MTNTSGVYPTEYKVLVEPIEVQNKIGSIYIPDETKERDQFAQMKGVLVAASPFAFTYENWDGKESFKPKPGETVLFAKYAGAVVDGRDGKKYRLINDKDIAAVLA